MTALLAIYLAIGLVLAVCWTAAEFRLGRRPGAMLSFAVFLLAWPLLAVSAAVLGVLAARFDPDSGRLRQVARRAMRRPIGPAATPQPAVDPGEHEPRPSRAPAS